MNKEDRLQLENELLMTCSKAQAINKYIDELEESSKLSELWCESQQENNQLKEQRQELRSWLEEALNELKQNDIYDRTSYEMGQVIATECIIEKLNELEGGKND